MKTLVLRSLINIGLPLVGLVVVAFALTHERVEDRSRRILSDTGASFGVGLDATKIVSVNFLNSDIDENVARELLTQPSLADVTFFNCHIGADVFNLVAQIPRLNSIRLSHSTWDRDVDFAAFMKSTRLHYIQFEQVHLTDAQVQAIDTTNLRSATLHNCGEVSLTGIQHLTEGKRLSQLSVEGVPVTRAEFSHLTQLRSELAVSVSHADVIEFQSLSESGARFELDDQARIVAVTLDSMTQELPTNALSRLAHLKVLTVKAVDVGPDFLKTVGGLKNLESLSLENCRVPADGLLALSELSNLWFLNLDGITFAGDDQASLPVLPSLRHLQAYSAALSNRLLKQIDMAALEFLSVGPNASLRDLIAAGRLPALKVIALDIATLNGRMNKALASLDQLTHVLVLDRMVAADNHRSGSPSRSPGSRLTKGESKSTVQIDALKKLSPSLSVMHL